MAPKWLKISEEIVRAANRQHPADAVLREALRCYRSLTPEEKRAISMAVFAYFRWFGWLDARKSIAEQIRSAQQLDERFNDNPRAIPDSELINRAVPAWVGKHLEVTPDWARSLQLRPKVFIRARARKGKALAGKLGDCIALEHLPDTLIYSGARDLFSTPEFEQGEFEVQDVTSQIVSLLCTPQPGETWWDACAGEGGKTLHLSDLMQNGGLIWASDRAEWRMKKLKRRTARAKVFNYRTAVWNGGKSLPTKTKFDGILIDAPCSGIGTWGRNPHARWTATENDVLELAEIQKRLLAHAAIALKPGGKLIYSVCTLARAETVDVTTDFESHFPEFKRLHLQNPLLPNGAPEDALWLLPQDTGGNGMFVVGWTRPKT
jgi:16S rRNA (cytosine967-C5)-methyltransferase